MLYFKREFYNKNENRLNLNDEFLSNLILYKYDFQKKDEVRVYDENNNEI